MEFVENLPPSYLPYRFLHKFADIFTMGKSETICLFVVVVCLFFCCGIFCCCFLFVCLFVFFCFFFVLFCFFLFVCFLTND